MPTNVWDITFPPDTQLANQLGSDIRNLKLDTQQRMALISGTLGARWNPGADAQPLNWTGLLYFATDTNQVFQWSGSAWVDITSSILTSRVIFDDNTPHIHTGTTTEDTIYTVAIPGNQIGLNGVLRFSLDWSQTIASGSPLVRIRFAGNQISAIGPTGTGAFSSISTFSNRNATNSQFYNHLYFTSLTIQPVSGTLAIDTTVNQNLTITVQSAANGDSQTFNQLFVELL